MPTLEDQQRVVEATGECSKCKGTGSWVVNSLPFTTRSCPPCHRTGRVRKFEKAVEKCQSPHKKLKHLAFTARNAAIDRHLATGCSGEVLTENLGKLLEALFEAEYFILMWTKHDVAIGHPAVLLQPSDHWNGQGDTPYEALVQAILVSLPKEGLNG